MCSLPFTVPGDKAHLCYACRSGFGLQKDLTKHWKVRCPRNPALQEQIAAKLLAKEQKKENSVAKRKQQKQDWNKEHQQIVMEADARRKGT